MSGYDCPCCGKLVTTNKAFTLRNCPHCGATVNEQSADMLLRPTTPTDGGSHDLHEAKRVVWHHLPLGSANGTHTPCGRLRERTYSTSRLADVTCRKCLALRARAQDGAQG